MVDTAPPGVDPQTDPSAPPAFDPSTLPPALQDIFNRYNYAVTPELAGAIAQWMLNQGIEMNIAQMDYQKQFIEQKSRELDLSEDQLGRMREEFEFQSGPYWDWFSGEAFEFQKEQARMEQETARLGFDTQKQLSSEEIARSKNMTLSTMYQTEAAKAQAEAAKWTAYAELGITRAPQVTSDELFWGGGQQR